MQLRINLQEHDAVLPGDKYTSAQGYFFAQSDFSIIPAPLIF